MKKDLTNKKNGPLTAIKGTFRRLRAGLLLLLLLPALGKAQYCNANFTSVTFEYLKNVTFAGMINNSTSGVIGGPQNFTTMVANVSATQQYTLSVTIYDDSNDYVYCWIDWNQNGILNDAGETYTIGGPVGAASGNLVLPTYTITVPPGAAVGMTRMRVMLDWNNGAADPCRNATYGETEDYSVNVIGPPCGTTPAANTINSPTAAICPGATAYLGMATNYTNSGITYLWQSSTTGTNSGWTAVPGGTNAAITTPTLGVSTWFQNIITCSNTGGSITVISSQVLVMPTTTNTVPYLETFEGIQGTNKLPNCSWNATNLNTSAFTYSVPQNGQNRIPHNGNAFASFYYSPAQTSNFYSNGIWFDAGVTYSANIWYTTDSYGYNTWELGLNYGPNQNQTGTVSIVSAKPAISGAYKLLSNTFQVTTSGLYYLNIQGKSNGTCCGYNLSWDDLEIMIPCALNSPTVGLSTSNTTICAGQQVVLTATGADAYVWNTGATTSAITEMPGTPNVYNYNVVGTNTLSGCSMSQSQQVLVNPSPMMGIIATPATACAGKPVTLSAYGADTYTWSSTGNGQSTVVNPTGPTSYTVLGTNIYNCSGQAVQQVNVNAIPVVAIVPTASNICAGETVTLTGNGAGATGTYVWKANTAYIAANPVPVSPNASTSYTLEGTDANGCVGSAFFSLGVDLCVGITESKLGNVSAYPNPTSGQFTIEMNDNSSKSVMVTDMMGRVISSTTTSNTKVNIDLGTAANGVYYVKVKSGNALEIVKVVKQ